MNGQSMNEALDAIHEEALKLLEHDLTEEGAGGVSK
jgi:hypothetical protein